MKYAGNESRGFVGVFKNDGKGNFTENFQRRLMQQQIKMASISCLQFITYHMIGIMTETLIFSQMKLQSLMHHKVL